jgi:hypothetical protein
MGCGSMVKLLPHFAFQKTTLCYDWGEAEGVTLVLHWLGLIVEVTVAHPVRGL